MYKIEDIEFKITKKRGLKHTYIYVRSDGEVEVRSSLLTSKKKIFEFVKQKREWIKKQQQKLTNKPNFDKLDRSSLKEKAELLIDPLVKKWAKIMEVDPKSVGYRYNKSRWGSCSGQNRLNFNTKLAMMPTEFVEYVVVHELSHIRHKNHSKEFWAEVERFLPDYKKRQKLTNFM